MRDPEQFTPGEEGIDRYMKLRTLLKDTQNNIPISKHNSSGLDDVQDNLFKVMCAILNLRIN